MQPIVRLGAVAMLGTVARAGEVLDLFDVESPEWGPSAVARQLEIAKSQAHELLASLSGIGLLQRSDRGRYRLGWRTLALGSDLLRSELDPVVIAMMRELATSFGANVQLHALERGRVVTLAGRRSAGQSRGGGALGVKRVESSVNLQLLALPESKVITLLQRGPDSEAPRSHSSNKVPLPDEIRVVRLQQASSDSDGAPSGNTAVAVAVHGRMGSSLVLSVSAASATWNSHTEALLMAVRITARRIMSCAADCDTV
jgi:DNA-binding IclR family transcriptional regulator